MKSKLPVPLEKFDKVKLAVSMAKKFNQGKTRKQIAAEKNMTRGYVSFLINKIKNF